MHPPASPPRPSPWAIDPADPRQMARLTLAYILLHLLVWTLLPAISHRAPPWDNIEQLVWTQSLQWGYYKHPPAPTWWMYFWTGLLGRTVWVTFFAAELSVAAMLVCVWRLALAFTTPLRAFVSVVLTSLVAYHGLRGIMANHNTLQLMPVGMLLWAVLAAVRAQGARRWLQWALVGAAAALTLLSKYSALVWFAVIGVWLLQDARMRSARAWAPVLLATGLGLVGVAPHLAWIAESGFASLHYAERSVEQGIAGNRSHWVDLWDFATTQLGRMVPALLALAWLRWLLRRDAVAAAPPAVLGERRFVLFMGLGPLLLPAGLAGASGTLARCRAGCRSLDLCRSRVPRRTARLAPRDPQRACRAGVLSVAGTRRFVRDSRRRPTTGDVLEKQACHLFRNIRSVYPGTRRSGAACFGLVRTRDRRGGGQPLEASAV